MLYQEVSSHTLSSIVTSDPYVAALFYEPSDESTQVILELEKIDDEADEFKIRFIKIRDRELAEEYSLTRLPALVYFRGGIPVVYHGDLLSEEDVLEWLIQHQTSADEEDLIEKVGDRQLEIMIENVDHLLVFYHDEKKRESREALEVLEQVDEEGDRIGVRFVKVTDKRTAVKNGVSHTSIPAVVYYEKEIPSVYRHEYDPDVMLAWLKERVEDAHIEGVKGEMLEKLIVKEEKMAVLFYKAGDEDCLATAKALEGIDDELDGLGALFVKNDQPHVAADYGIDALPSLVVFDNGVPNLYEGDLADEDHVLTWIIEEVSGDDTVEVVTDQMIERLIKNRNQVAVFLYDKKDKESRKALDVLEDINDDIEDISSLSLVKTNDKDVAVDYGISSIPALIFFDTGVPNVYKGDLMSSDAVLEWLEHLAKEDNIEEVNAKILQNLIDENDMPVVVYVYQEGSEHDETILADLETIDDDLEDLDVHLLKFADDSGFADKHGVDVVPALVLFEDGVAHVFDGDVGTEHKAFEWVRDVLKIDDDDDDD